MKIKINWGWAIVIALASFMIFISVLVVQLMFKKEYDHELVSKNYYKDELLYQLELNKLKNAEKLPQDITIKIQEDQLFIIFPDYMNYAAIKGSVRMQYVIEEQYDFELPIVLTHQKFIIDGDKMKKGLWYISVDWEYESESYLYKNKIRY
ncbi:MAG: FixH family protein [Bacteroidetes bacterium]|jgi:hypothetical protein|nr:FixH family protein [Bacteroidota bacterium]